MALSPVIQIVSFDEVPGWSRDRHAGAYAAFRRSAFHVLSKPYRTGALGVEFSAFADAYADARACESQDAKVFFERHFIPARIIPDDRPSGFVTGFYEPEVEASPIRTDRFGVPLLARPANLVDVDNANRPSGMDPYLAFARQTPQCLVEYFDRRAIEQGALAGVRRRVPSAPGRRHWRSADAGSGPAVHPSPRSPGSGSRARSPSGTSRWGSAEDPVASPWCREGGGPG